MDIFPLKIFETIKCCISLNLESFQCRQHSFIVIISSVQSFNTVVGACISIQTKQVSDFVTACAHFLTSSVFCSVGLDLRCCRYSFHFIKLLVRISESSLLFKPPNFSPSVEVTLDQDTANPDLLITDEKKMRCGFERKDVPNYHQRFDGWWCAAAVEGFSSGRHYWEVEVGERDWRLGVAKESALRKGFKSLNTNTGYLTLRLERGSELKALTVPFTALPPGLIPRRVGIYLDYDHGQLSFYDVDKHLHVFTYNESFDEKLFPLFGTVEIAKDLVIKSPAVKTQCFCLWG